jgi:glycosyltransferase involved in cell wall biosynthesis
VDLVVIEQKADLHAVTTAAPLPAMLRPSVMTASIGLLEPTRKMLQDRNHPHLHDSQGAEPTPTMNTSRSSTGDRRPPPPSAARAERVLIVLHDFALGGTERIALRLAGAWARAGRQVTIFCGDPTGPLARLRDPAVELVAASPAIARAPGSRRRLGRALAALLRGRRFDVLFTPGNTHWAVLPALGSTPADRRPRIVAQISAPLFRHGRGPLRQRIYNANARRRLALADVLVTLSPETVRDAHAVLGARRVHSLPLPALEDEAAAPQPAAGELILCIGRLVPEKGFDLALRAFARLPDHDARLAVLGEGPERNRLERLAAELGVAARVTFEGYVADVAPWLARARLLLLTSRFEGYAAVIVEALGAGRPVVATDCTPAARELLGHPGAGAIAAIGDAAGLARALQAVLAAPPPDPEALAKLVAPYRLGPVSQAYLELFDSLTASP